MKQSIISKILTLCVTVMISLPVIAQEDALKDFPGYVDFGQLTAVFGEPSVQISVGESLLGLVGSLSASEDPEAAELFKRLNGVRVNVFETEAMADGAIGLVKDVSARLVDPGLGVCRHGQFCRRAGTYLHDDQRRTVQGITVMAVEETEAVFVNVIGSINPEELGKVMENFDIDIDGADRVNASE